MADVETEHVLSGDGTRIAFDRRGAGPVLVLVDGVLSERRTGPMRPLAVHLATAFTVVTYDRRGRGESTDATGDVRGYAVERELDDLRSLLEAVLDGARDVALHGASTGGLLALHAVGAGLPVRSVSLVEPPFGACATVGAGFVGRLTHLLDQGRRADVVTTFQRAVGVPEELALAGGPAFAPHAPTVVYDCVLTSALTPDLLRGVQVPALVVESTTTGGRVARWTAAAVAALPRGEHVALAGVWHGVPDADLARTLTAFHRR
ncbi:alpha/beta fold hydrolase [Kineococcus rhizosphaerae]|uniref:alpha/beta fold hydrolase n=1 Tax=Kineococcus rhizosphaerae TaxID=559628 RepID=UPI001B80E30B|nr:alpha/beta hydrolase [Kineococcus rhizosphaerae]